MNTIRLFSLTAAMAIAVALLPAAGAAEPPAWNWAAGDSARYQLTQTMGMSMNAGPAGTIETTRTEAKLLALSVESVAADGAARLRQATERVVMRTNGPGGQSFEYDSASEERPVGMAALVAPMFEALVAADVLVTMSPRGELSEIEMSEALAEAFDRLPGGAVSADMVKQMAQQGLPTFPEAAIEIGDTWITTKRVDSPKMGTLNVTTIYEYVGPRDWQGRAVEAFATITEVEPDESGGPAPLRVETIESFGKMLFDAAAGRLVSNTSDQRMNVTVSVPGGEVTGEMRQSFELRELGPAEGLTLDEPAIESGAEAAAASATGE